MKQVKVFSVIALTLFLSGCFSSYGISTNYSNSSSVNNSEYSDSTEGVEETLSTDSEITFRGLDWGVQSETAKELMENDTENPFVFIINEAPIPKTDNPFTIDPTEYVNGSSGTVISLGGVTAGGYDTLECKMYFHYTVDDMSVDRDNDSFYLAKYSIECVNTVETYNSLFNKLSELYGTGVEDSWESTGFLISEDYSGLYTKAVRECIWTGSNNTFVALRGESSENESAWVGVWLAYGKSDAEESLNELEDAIQRENEESEKEIGKSENNTGL